MESQIKSKIAEQNARWVNENNKLKRKAESCIVTENYNLWLDVYYESEIRRIEWLGLAVDKASVAGNDGCFDKPKLTSKESEILNLMLQGLSSEEIAKVLLKSKHTVRSHVRKLYAKFNVHSKHSLILKLHPIAGSSKRQVD